MGRYVFQRVMLTVPTLFGLTLLIFLALRLIVPIDAFELAYSENGSDPARVQQLREEFGLTGSLAGQYLRWVGGVLQGDLGTSFFSRKPVTEELLARVPTSLELGLGALAITLVLAIPIGIMSAARQDTWPDYLTRGGAILFYAIPGFWIGILVIVFSSLLFGWAPSSQYRTLWEDPAANLRHIWLPMVILGLNSTGVMIRLTRTQVLEVVKQDYIRTARAKGLSTRDIYARHVLRNSLLPIVTVVGLQVPSIVSGTLIFEQLFLVPGVGRYLLQALQRLDIYVVLGTNLFFGTVIVMSNLIVDLTYGFIDPRIRLR
jgi:peptide/nickel transport system permease protein